MTVRDLLLAPNSSSSMRRYGTIAAGTHAYNLSTAVLTWNYFIISFRSKLASARILTDCPVNLLTLKKACPSGAVNSIAVK